MVFLWNASINITSNISFYIFILQFLGFSLTPDPWVTKDETMAFFSQRTTEDKLVRNVHLFNRYPRVIKITEGEGRSVSSYRRPAHQRHCNWICNKSISFEFPVMQRSCSTCIPLFSPCRRSCPTWRPRSCAWCRREVSKPHPAGGRPARQQ